MPLANSKTRLLSGLSRATGFAYSRVRHGIYICYRTSMARLSARNPPDRRKGGGVDARPSPHGCSDEEAVHLPQFRKRQVHRPINDWWSNHGSRTRSKFEYRTPRILSVSGRKRRARSPRMPSADSWPIAEKKISPPPASISTLPSCVAYSTMAIRFEKYDKNPVSVFRRRRNLRAETAFRSPRKSLR